MNQLYYQTFGAPKKRSICRRQRGAKVVGSRRMFWQLAAEDGIGKPTDLGCAKRVREWNPAQELCN